MLYATRKRVVNIIMSRKEKNNAIYHERERERERVGNIIMSQFLNKGQHLITIRC